MSDIREILGKFSDAAESTPVDIRESDYTLVSRGSLANIGNMAHSLRSGEYLASISLPLGVHIIQPISVTADGTIDLKQIANRVINTVSASEQYKSVLNYPLATSVVRSAASAIPPILKNFDASSIKTHPLLGSFLAGLQIEPQGAVEPKPLLTSQHGKQTQERLDDINAVWVRTFKGGFAGLQFESLDPSKPLLTSGRECILIENRASTASTLQLLRMHEPALNIIIPPSSNVRILRGVDIVGLNIVMEFGVPVADELIRLRTAGHLCEMIGVATSLAVPDIINIATINATAAIAVAYIVLQACELAVARKIIDKLGEIVPNDTDTYVLTAELDAREGQHASALDKFLAIAKMDLPKFSFGLSKLVDRLRFYSDVLDIGHLSAPGKSNTVKAPFRDGGLIGKEVVLAALNAVQPFASRCDFNLLFTNYTGLSPAQPDETVLDRAAIAATDAVPYSLTPTLKH